MILFSFIGGSVMGTIIFDAFVSFAIDKPSIVLEWIESVSFFADADPNFIRMMLFTLSIGSIGLGFIRSDNKN